MYTHEDISTIKTRVSLLEAAQIDSTNKIVTLVEGFNQLNVNLTTLIASINIGIKTALVGTTLVATLVGGVWGYNTSITNQINRATGQTTYIDRVK